MPLLNLAAIDPAIEQTDSVIRRRHTMAGYEPSCAIAAASTKPVAASMKSRSRSTKYESSTAAARTRGHSTSTWSIPAKLLPTAATGSATCPAVPAPKKQQQEQQACTVRFLCLLNNTIQLHLFFPVAAPYTVQKAVHASPVPASVPEPTGTAIIPCPPSVALQLPSFDLAKAAKAQVATERLLQVQILSAAEATTAASSPTLDLELSPDEVQWLVQPPVLPSAVYGPPAQTTRTTAVSRLLSHGATTACRLCSRASTKASASMPNLRSRLNAASCIGRPVVAE